MNIKFFLVASLIGLSFTCSSYANDLPDLIAPVSIPGALPLGGPLSLDDQPWIPDGYSSSDGLLKEGSFSQCCIGDGKTVYSVRFFSQKDQTAYVSSISVPFNKKQDAEAYRIKVIKSIEKQTGQKFYKNDNEWDSKYYNIWYDGKGPWNINVSIQFNIAEAMATHALIARENIDLKFGPVTVLKDTYDDVKRKIKLSKTCKSNHFSSFKGNCLGFPGEQWAKLEFNQESVLHAARVEMNDKDKIIFNALKKELSKKYNNFDEYADSFSENCDFNIVNPNKYFYSKEAKASPVRYHLYHIPSKKLTYLECNSLFKRTYSPHYIIKNIEKQIKNLEKQDKSIEKLSKDINGLI